MKKQKTETELLKESYYIIEGLMKNYNWKDHLGSDTKRISDLMKDLELYLKLNNTK